MSQSRSWPAAEAILISKGPAERFVLVGGRPNVLGQRVHGPELADFSVVEACPLGELYQEPRYRLADGSGDSDCSARWATGARKRARHRDKLA